MWNTKLLINIMGGKMPTGKKGVLFGIFFALGLVLSYLNYTSLKTHEIKDIIVCIAISFISSAICIYIPPFFQKRRKLHDQK